jgi:hypothetical protein
MTTPANVLGWKSVTHFFLKQRYQRKDLKQWTGHSFALLKWEVILNHPNFWPAAWWVPMLKLCSVFKALGLNASLCTQAAKITKWNVGHYTLKGRGQHGTMPKRLAVQQTEHQSHQAFYFLPVIRVIWPWVGISSRPFYLLLPEGKVPSSLTPPTVLLCSTIQQKTN